MLLQEFTYKDYGEVRYDEGREEGREEERYDIARNALLMNLSIDEISKLTRLTHEEVNHLRMMN